VLARVDGRRWPGGGRRPPRVGTRVAGGGGGGDGIGFVVGVGSDLALVPGPVVLERVENVLAVGVDEVGPRLPERVNDVVDETDLHARNNSIHRSTVQHLVV